MTHFSSILNVSLIFLFLLLWPNADMMQFQDSRIYSDLPFKGVGQENMVAEPEACGSHCVCSQEAKTHK